MQGEPQEKKIKQDLSTIQVLFLMLKKLLAQAIAHPQKIMHNQLVRGKRLVPRKLLNPSSKMVVLKKNRGATRSINYITNKINPRLEFLVEHLTLSSHALYLEIFS